MSAPTSSRRPGKVPANSPSLSPEKTPTIEEIDKCIAQLNKLRREKNQGDGDSEEKTSFRSLSSSASATLGNDDPSSHGSTTLFQESAFLSDPLSGDSSSAVAAISHLPTEFLYSQALLPADRRSLVGDSGMNLESKIMGTMYDQVFSALTYSPAANVRPFLDVKEEYFTMADKGTPVEPSSFNNLYSPANTTGDLAQSQYFSEMVNVNAYLPSGLESVYETIINSANAQDDTDPAKKEIYDKAYKYLYATTTVTDFLGDKQEVDVESPVYANYKKNQIAYSAAVSAYRTAFNNLDMKKSEDQRKWLSMEPPLKTAMDQAYAAYRNGAAFVEQAVNTLNSLGQSLAKTTISRARQVFSDTSLGSMTHGTPNWHLSYSFPPNWATDDKSYSQIKVDTSKLHETSSSEYTKWGGSAGLSYGLFSFGGSAGGSSSKEQSHMDATQVSIAFKVAIVRISRPWFQDSLFSVKGWNLPKEPKGKVSIHDMNTTQGKLIPSYPTGFVVVKEVEITANWSEKDRTTLSKSLSTSASAGWGPFRVSGNYEHGSKSDDFTASMQGNTIKIPGMQIIGYINKIVPFSPQLDG